MLNTSKMADVCCMLYIIIYIIHPPVEKTVWRMADD